MKTLITAAILTLSFGASATSCEVIGKSVVDQYTLAAGFSTETAAQKAAYSDLVAAHVKTCRSGVEVRNKGGEPQDVATIIGNSYRSAERVANINQVVSKAMTISSYSQGFAFGE